MIIVTFEMKVIDYTTFKAFHYSGRINAKPFYFFILLEANKPETVISWLFIFAQLYNIFLWEHQSWSRNLILKNVEMWTCVMKGNTDLHGFPKQRCD